MRLIDTELTDFLKSNEPFAYCHLVKFQRPYNTNIVSPDVITSTDANKYSYISDASYDILFDDGSYNSTGSPNGVQTYFANKLLSIGSIQEEAEARVSNISINLDGTSLGAYITGEFTLNSLGGQVYGLTAPAGIELVEHGFKEGDKITLTSNSITGDFSVISFLAGNTFKVRAIDFTPQPGTVSGVLAQASDELVALLADKSSSSYMSYRNKKVEIYRAYINVETREIIGSPILLFSGVLLNGGTIKQDSTGNISISWTVSSYWGDFQKVNGRITSDPSHRALNNAGVPQPQATKKTEYAYDKGFNHSETSVNTLATYKVDVEKQDIKYKKGFLGIGSKIKVTTYTVKEDRNVNLSFNLGTDYIPVVYGVRATVGIPIFADTLANAPDTVYTANVLSEGPIGGIYDMVVNGSSLICSSFSDYSARNTSVTGLSSNTVLCRGRADRGDVLDSESVVNSDVSIQYYANYNAYVSQKGINPLAYDTYFEYTDIAEPTMNDLTGRGVTDGKGILISSPISINVDLYSGKQGQQAASNLVTIAQNNGFKVQQDYWADKSTLEYWGPNHRLVDTAYAVVKNVITSNDTTLPELSYIVRGKFVESYNYDYSFEHNPEFTSESSSNFSLGDTVELFNTSNQKIGEALIVDKWSFIGRDNTVQERFRFKEQPDLDYTTRGLPTVTSFYMKKGTSVWHMLTHNHIFDEQTVPTNIIAGTISSLSSNSGKLRINFTGSVPAEALVSNQYGQSAFFKVVDPNTGVLLSSYTEVENLLLVGTFGPNYLDTALLYDDYSKFSTILAGNKLVSANSIKLSSSPSSVVLDNSIAFITRTASSGDVSVFKSPISTLDSTYNVVILSDILPLAFIPKVGDKIKFLSKGDQRVSINPAIQLLDYITSSVYGAGLSLDKLNLPTWLNTAINCDGRSNVTVAVVSSSGVNIGATYEFSSYGRKFTGTVESIKSTNLGSFITFKDVLGKLTNKWKSWKSYKQGEVLYNTAGVHYLTTEAGVKTSEPTHTSGTINGLYKIADNELIFNLLSGGGSSTLAADITKGNAVRNFDNGIETSGYSLYDSDDVDYWRYIGWDDEGQRNVTKYQTNILLDTAQPVFDNINSFLGHFDGILRQENGQYVLETLEYPASIEEELQIDESHIIGDISITDDGSRTTYNAITVNFLDPANKFESKSISFFNSNYIKQDNGVEKKGNLTIPGVTNYLNARMLAEKFLIRSRYGLTINLTLEPLGILFVPGTIFSLSYKRFGWVSKTFKVDVVTAGNDTLVDIVASEVNEAMFLRSSVSGAPQFATNFINTPSLGDWASYDGKNPQEIIDDIEKEIIDRQQGDAAEATSRTNAILAEATTRANQIATEAQTRANQIAAEASARANAITSAVQAEALERANAINAEAQARATEIANEAAARANAISAEAATRANAISAEATARYNADISEATIRANAISTVAQDLVNGLAASAQADAQEAAARLQGDLDEYNARTAAITAEATARINGIAAEATARGIAINAKASELTAYTNSKVAEVQSFADALAAEVAGVLGTEAYNNSTTYAAGDLVEYDSKLYRATQTTLGHLPTNTTYWEKVGDYASLGEAVAAHSAALADQDARITQNANAITAEATARTQLGADLTNLIGTKASTSAVSTLEARITSTEGVNTSQATDLTSLRNDLNSTNGLVNTKADSSAVSSLESRVTSTETSLSSQSSSVTNLQNSYTLETENRVVNPSFDDEGDGWYLGWEGNTGLPTIGGRNGPTDDWFKLTNNFWRTVNGTPADGTVYDILNINVYSNPSTLVGLRKFAVPATVGDRFFVSAKVAVHRAHGARVCLSEWDGQGTNIGEAYLGNLAGRNTNGAFSDPNNYERSAGFYTITNPNTRFLTMYVRVFCSGEYNPYGWAIQPMIAKASAGQTAWPPYTSTRSDTSKASSTAVSLLTSRVSSSEGVITSNSTAITSLTNSLSSLSGTVSTKADASALNALESRVTSAEGVNTSQAESITSLGNSISSVQGSLSTKADASALNALESRVTSAEGVNTSQSNSLTSLSNSLSNLTGVVNTKASSSALTSLETRVSDTENNLVSQSNQVTSLNSSVASLDARRLSVENIVARAAWGTYGGTGAQSNVSWGTARWGLRLSGPGTQVEGAYLGNLKINTPYSLRFKARMVAGGSHTLHVDLHPDSLPEAQFTVTSTAQTFVWENQSSNSGDMSSAALRFFSYDMAAGAILEITDIVFVEGAQAPTGWTPAQADWVAADSALQTSFNASLSTVNSTLTDLQNGKASVSSVTSLESRMASAEGVNTSQAGALSGLDSRVSSNESGTLSNSNNITSLQNNFILDSGNHLSNPDFTDNLDGWKWAWDGNSGMTVTRRRNGPGPEWYGVTNTVFAHIAGTPAATTVFDIITPKNDSREELKRFAMPVQAGERIFASAYAAMHRASGVQVVVIFWDANGTYMNEAGVGSMGGRSYGAGNGDPANMDRIGGFATVPAGAQYVTLFFRVTASGENEPYAWISRPMMCRASASQTAWPMYNSLRVDATKADASALSALDSRVGAAEGTITSHSTQLTSLNNSVSTINGTLGTLATSSALSVLESRVTATEGVNTSQSSSITNLNGSINNLQGQIDTKAAASAVSALEGRVTATEGTVSSNSSSITNLNNSVNSINGQLATKADASALSSLASRVASTESGITSNSNSITSLTNRFSTRNNLVPNGGMTSELAGWSVPSGFTFTNNEVWGPVVWGWFSGTTAVNTPLFQVYPGWTYTASGDLISTNATSGETYIDIIWFDESFSFIGETGQNPISAGNDFDPNDQRRFQWALTAIAPTNARWAYTRAVFESVSSGGGLALCGCRRMKAEVGNYATAFTDDRQRYADGTAISSLTSRVTATEGSITSVSGSVTNLTNNLSTLQGQVNNKAEASAVSALESRVSSVEGVNSSQSSDLTSLRNDLNSTNGWVNTKADSSALSALESRVTSTEGVNTSQATNLTNLNASVSNLQGQIDTKASASALSALDSRVTAAEGVNSSQSSSLTALNNSIVKSSTNLIFNSSFDLDLQGWDYGSDGSVGAGWDRQFEGGGTWSGQVRTFRLSHSGTPPVGWADAINTKGGLDGYRKYGVQLKGGERLFVASYFGLHRCVGVMVFAYWDINGNYVGEAQWRSTYEQALFANGDPNNAVRLGGFTIAPNNARYATVHLRCETTGAANPVMFVGWPMVSSATTNQTAWPDYSKGEGDSSRASSTAVSALESRVTATEGNITSNSNSITSLGNSITNLQNSKADASALNTLSNTVSNQGNSINSNSVAITSLNNTVVASSDNLLVNSDFVDGLTGWSPSWNGNGNQNIERGLNWSGFWGTRNSQYIRISGSTSQGAVVDAYQTRANGLEELRRYAIPVMPNELYFVSAYVARHRFENATCVLSFYNASGSEFDGASVGSGGRGYGGNDGDLANFDRIGGFVRIPSGARYMGMRIRASTLNDFDPYLFITAPMIARAQEGQTRWPEYTPGRQDPIRASSEALQAIDSRVTANEGTITSQSNAITALTNRVGSRPNLIPNANLTNGNTGWSWGLPNTIVETHSVWGPVIWALNYNPNAYNGTTTINSPKFRIEAGWTYTASGDIICICDQGVYYHDMIWMDQNENVIGETAQSEMNGSIDFDVNDQRRYGHSITATAPTGAFWGIVRTVFYNIVNGQLLGTRRVKCEVGSYPTAFSDERQSFADGIAITSLTSRVTVAEGNISSTSQSVTNLSNDLNSQVGNLQGQINNKAESSALNSLTSTVNSINGTVSSNSGAITNLQNSVNSLNTNKADASALNTLQNTVNSQGNTINSNSTNITSLQNSLTLSNTNLLFNSTFATLEGWEAGWNGNHGLPDNVVIRALNWPDAGWYGVTNVMAGHIAGTPPAGTVADIYQNTYSQGLEGLRKYAVSVNDGERLFVGAWVAFHRASKLDINILWSDGNGNAISEAGVAWGGRYGGGGYGDPANMDRIGGFINVPNGARFARLYLRMVFSGEESPYFWVTQPMVTKAYATQTAWPSYTSGKYDATRASSTALSALDSRVTASEGNITSNSNSITSLNNSITNLNNNKADASALNSLSNTVSSQGNTLSSLSTNLTNLSNRVGTRNNILPNGGFMKGLESWNYYGVPFYHQHVSENWGDVVWWFGNYSGHASVESYKFQAWAGWTYTASADCIKFADSGNTFIDMIYFDGSGNIIGDGGETVINYAHDFDTNDQRRYQLASTSTAPAGTTHAIIRIYFHTLTNATALGVRRAKVEVGTYATAFSDEQQVFAEAGAQTALTSRVTTAEGNISSISGSITSLNNSITDLNNNKASASALSSLESRVSSAEGTISSHSGSITYLNNTLSDAFGQISTKASASALNAVESRVSSAEGTISSHTSSINSLNSTVGSNSSSISTLQSTTATQAGQLTTLSARYALRLDVNGRIIGWEANNNGTTGNIVFNADNLKIASPTGDVTPFSVDTANNMVTMSNVAVKGKLIINQMTASQVGYESIDLPAVAVYASKVEGINDMNSFTSSNGRQRFYSCGTFTNTPGTYKAHRVKNGTTRFIVSVSATVDAYLSVWYTTSYTQDPVYIARAVDPAGGMGTVSLTYAVEIEVPPGATVQFYFSVNKGGSGSDMWDAATGTRSVEYCTACIQAINYD